MKRMFPMLSFRLFPKLRTGIRNARMMNKLLVAFVLLSVIPLAITGIFSADSSARAIRGKIDAYALQLIRQVARNIDTNLARIRNYSDDLIISADISNRLFGYKDEDGLGQSSIRGYFFMKLQLGFINMPNIDDVMMVFNRKDGDPPYDTTHVAMQYRWKAEEIERLIALNNAPDNDRNFTLSATPISGTGGDDIVIGRRIGNTPTLEVLGHLLIAVRQDFFNDTYHDVSIGSGSHVFVLSSDGTMISGILPGETIGKPHSDAGFTARIRAADAEALARGGSQDGTFAYALGGDKHLVSFSRIGTTDLYAVMTVPYAYLNQETAQFAVNIALLSLLVLALAIGASVIIARNIAAPLGHLAADMAEFGDGTLHRRATVDRDDEVGHLQHSFNAMATDIERLMDRIGEENRIRRMSELRVLEYQINPHFLYNTLDSINWMAQKAGQTDIGDMVTALARFYRLGLSKGREFYTVRDELAHASNYLIISRIRFRDCFRFEVDAEPDVMDCRTLRIILQPLAENAIKYGINKQRTDGVIRLTARRAGERLRLSVIDNGPGIPPGRLNAINSALSRMRSVSENEDGFGLLNVHERIRLTYGDGFGVHLESTEGTGTEAVIELPADCGGAN